MAVNIEQCPLSFLKALGDQIVSNHLYKTQEGTTLSQTDIIAACLHVCWGLEEHLEVCLSCQSFAGRQEPMSVYRPAGKEEIKVLIKSVCEVKGVR